MSATRWATQFVAEESVAVLLPVAPELACAPSAPVERALLAGELVEATVYSCVRPWLASCVAVTVDPETPCAL